MKPYPLKPKQQLFNLSVFSGDVADFLGILHADPKPQTIAYLNAHTVNLAHSEPEFLELLCRMDVLYADGMSIVKTSHRAGRPLAERINAGDFIERFLWSCNGHHATVALVGSAPGIAEAAAKVYAERLGETPIRFTNHGFFLGDAQAKSALEKTLQQSPPDFLLLGLGSPQQERLALEWSELLPNTTIWCVGALFEYSAGRWRAPVWVRLLGLEWVVRLMLEPKRLWKRYLIGNPTYLIHEWRWRKTLR